MSYSLWMMKLMQSKNLFISITQHGAVGTELLPVNYMSASGPHSTEQPLKYNVYVI